MGDNADEDVEMIEVPVAVEMEGTLTTGMISKIEGPVTVMDNGTFNIIEGVDKTTPFEADKDWDGNDSNNHDRDNRDRNSEGQGNFHRSRRWDNNNRGHEHNDRGRGRRWNPNQQYHDPGYRHESQFSNPSHYHPPPMGHQYTYPIPYDQYSYPQQQHKYQSQMLPAPSQQATNICQLCNSQGHYDY